MAKVKDGRARNWTFVLYPESAPVEWSDVLNDLHIQWCVSPLHDKDVNADGTPKKPHWHVLLCFEGNKSQDQVDAISHSINGTICQKVSSVRGMVRYFTHMDNPEKYQYPASQIGCHGGFDPAEYLTLSKSYQLDIVEQMENWIQENDVYYLHELTEYARMYHRDDWYPALVFHNCYYIVQLLKERRESLKHSFDSADWPGTN